METVTVENSAVGTTSRGRLKGKLSDVHLLTQFSDDRDDRTSTSTNQIDAGMEDRVGSSRD